MTSSESRDESTNFFEKEMRQMKYSEIVNRFIQLLSAGFLRNLAVSILAGIFGLGLFAMLSPAQTKKPKTNQKEIPMTQTTAKQQNTEQSTDKEAIRPFRVNIP